MQSLYHVAVGQDRRMAEKQRPTLETGDIAPTFEAFDAHGKLLGLGSDAVSGKPHVMVFVRDPQDPAVLRGLQQLAGWSDRLAGLGAETFVLLPLTPPQVLAYQREHSLPFQFLSDPPLDAARRLVSQLLVAEGPPIISVVLRPNRHVMAVLDDHAADHGDIACAYIETLAAQRAHRQGEMHAPVLMVPDVFSPKDCQRLMTVFAMQGNEFVDPGHGVQNRKQDYKMRIPDYGRNDRVDHWVITQETNNFIAQRLWQRVLPEVRKAFQYTITKHERFRIGQYKASGGDIIGASHGHRDNTDAQVAHRRFACSVNLNAESHDGGGLIFPEYGGQEYSPRTGEALVFSSSMLHEVRPVRKGTRYVVLSFLFGDT